MKQQSEAAAAAAGSTAPTNDTSTAINSNNTTATAGAAALGASTGKNGLCPKWPSFRTPKRPNLNSTGFRKDPIQFVKSTGLSAFNGGGGGGGGGHSTYMASTSAYTTSTGVFHHHYSNNSSSNYSNHRVQSSVDAATFMPPGSFYPPVVAPGPHKPHASSFFQATHVPSAFPATSYNTWQT